MQPEAIPTAGATRLNAQKLLPNSRENRTLFPSGKQFRPPNPSTKRQKQGFTFYAALLGCHRHQWAMVLYRSIDGGPKLTQPLLHLRQQPNGVVHLRETSPSYHSGSMPSTVSTYSFGSRVQGYFEVIPFRANRCEQLLTQCDYVPWQEISMF